MTVNGPVTVHRSVYWNRQKGSVIPIDQWLGISQRRYSPGVREMCCREASRSSFRRAREDLMRVGQIHLSHETLRSIVETEGLGALDQQRRGEIGPGWTADDCVDKASGQSCLITGADGVMVPLVTEQEKSKRRQLRKRVRNGRKRRHRIRRGSDQSYKEFKIVTFYDPSHEHQYAVGTGGNHEALGRLMRREARKLRLDLADLAYSLSDGAGWIWRQYQLQLPMLKDNVLDYYHLRDHIIVAGYALFGEGSEKALGWRKQMCGCALERGPVALLESLVALRKTLRGKSKREALKGLIGYIARRLPMLDYPRFLAAGYDIGSGPTEAFCKTLTSRLKGPGMRWDKPHAEAMMTLASVRSSRLWDAYWQKQRQTVA